MATLTLHKLPCLEAASSPHLARVFPASAILREMLWYSTRGAEGRESRPHWSTDEQNVLGLPLSATGPATCGVWSARVPRSTRRVGNAMEFVSNFSMILSYTKSTEVVHLFDQLLVSLALRSVSSPQQWAV